MTKLMKGSYLLSDGFMKEGTGKAFLVTAFEDGPKGWRNGSLPRRAKVKVDILIFKKYTSYVMFTVGGYKLAMPIEGNGDWLQAVIATREFGVVSKLTELATKGGRKKYLQMVALDATSAKELYEGMLLFGDKEMVVKHELGQEHFEHVLSRLKRYEDRKVN